MQATLGWGCEVKSLTYNSVVSVFDEALRMSGWPEADASIPFDTPSPDSDSGHTNNVEAGTKRARAEDVEQDNARVSKKPRMWASSSSSGWASSY